MALTKRTANLLVVVAGILVMAYFIVGSPPKGAPASRTLGQLQLAADNWHQYQNQPPSSLPKSMILSGNSGTEAMIQPDTSTVTWYGQDGVQYLTNVVSGDGIVGIFNKDGYFNYSVGPSSASSTLLSVLLQVVPTLLLLGFFLWVVMRYSQAKK